MSERKRSSGSHNRLNKARQAMAAFCDHEFLTRHSLFANLYASEPLKIDLSDD